LSFLLLKLNIVYYKLVRIFNTVWKTMAYTPNFFGHSFYILHSYLWTWNQYPTMSRYIISGALVAQPLCSHVFHNATLVFTVMRSQVFPSTFWGMITSKKKENTFLLVWIYLKIVRELSYYFLLSFQKIYFSLHVFPNFTSMILSIK